MKEQQSVKTTFKCLVVVLGFVVAIGLVIAGFFLYSAWQHNPQCEFHCEGVIHWSTWLPYASIGWVLATICAIPLVAIVALAATLFNGRRK
jgi:hypothetical protein